MKPLPDLSSDTAMAARGRLSALKSARNEAAEELRTVFVAVQSSGFSDMPKRAEELRSVAERLDLIAGLWESLA